MELEAGRAVGGGGGGQLDVWGARLPGAVAMMPPIPRAVAVAVVPGHHRAQHPQLLLDLAVLLQCDNFVFLFRVF